MKRVASTTVLLGLLAACSRDVNVQLLPEDGTPRAAALQKTLRPPPLIGADSGDLLVIGWGSTKGAIEEAVEVLRGEGHRVSSLHLTFLQPLPPGLKEIMQRFKAVMTIEGNWCDRPHDQIIDETNRRYSALAMLLRSRYLIDVDCWSEVRGQPIKPDTIRRVLREKLRAHEGRLS